MSDAAPPTLDALTRALDDPDGEVRVAAVHALGRLDRAEAESALLWALQSPDYRVALAARAVLQPRAKPRGPDSTLWRDPSVGPPDARDHSSGTDC